MKMKDNPNFWGTIMVIVSMMTFFTSFSLLFGAKSDSMIYDLNLMLIIISPFIIGKFVHLNLKGK